MVHELNISKREAERLKDIVKARDSKIDQFKEQINQKEKVDQLNQILQEQLDHRDKELAAIHSRFKKLKGSTDAIKQEVDGTSQLREENERLTNKATDLEIEKKVLTEQNLLSARQIEEVLNEQAPKTMSEKQKMDWVTKLRKEIIELKQENTKLQESLRLSKQKQPVSAPAQRLKQSLPPNGTKK